MGTQGSRPARGLRRALLSALALTAAVAAVSAAAGTQRADRATAWRVVDFSFRYDEAAQFSQACAEGSVSGFDVAQETAHLDLGKLHSVRRIDYQYTPGLRAGPGGPDSRGHSLLAMGDTVQRTIDKELVDCDTGEHRTVTCSDAVHGQLGSDSTGAYAVWTNRKKSVVNMSILLMGTEFNRMMTCPGGDDPGVVIGASFLEAATHDAYQVRTTVPLAAFRRSTTTVTLSRTLAAPADAAARGFPTGSVKVEAKLVLKKQVVNHIGCPARDPLFVCDNR